MSDFRAEQLPAFRAWSERFDPPADTTMYLIHEVSVTTATVLSELFFPELVEVRGCVVIASKYEPSNFESWWNETKDDRKAIESTINHLHLWDLFDSADEPEDDALDVLAQRIAVAWRCAAEAAFPDREFKVSVTDDYGPTVAMSSSPRR